MRLGSHKITHFSIRNEIEDEGENAKKGK